MTCLELRRKVGYKPRKRAGPHRQKKHSQARSYAHFDSMAEDLKASAWKMDSVMGHKQDGKRLLTLYHRPSSFQLVLPLEDGTSQAVADVLGGLRDVLGPQGMCQMFGPVLTDNGSAFSDEDGLGALLGETRRDPPVLLRTWPGRPRGAVKKPCGNPKAAAQRQPHSLRSLKRGRLRPHHVPDQLRA